MIFGKIEYLNLLPFHLFMKRFVRSSSAKMSMEYKRGVPSAINAAFHHRRVDAAFISSISAKKSKHLSLGIIAKREVKSVLIIPHKKEKKDSASATSNLLADILGYTGEVLIGDRALAYALSHDDYIDMALAWHKRYGDPFVFALLCYHNRAGYYKKVEREFLKKKIKIPYYILERASQKTQIQKSDILEYLTLISYHVDTKALRGLKKFYKEAKRFG